MDLLSGPHIYTRCHHSKLKHCCMLDRLHKNLKAIDSITARGVGSIGTQTLDIVNEHGDRFEVVALAAGGNVALLAEQVGLEPYPLLEQYGRGGDLCSLYSPLHNCLPGLHRQSESVSCSATASDMHFRTLPLLNVSLQQCMSSGCWFPSDKSVCSAPALLPSRDCTKADPSAPHVSLI